VPSAEPNRRHGEVFDGVAQEYDDVRRGYPAALVEAALMRGRLAAGSRVVEVGCGTGKLTELLAAHGLEIDAVDPGSRMIEVARRRVGGSPLVRFHVARFEDVELPERSFDALFSATAFHWVDPTIGWRKAASLLKPGGLLALLAHSTVVDERSAELDAGYRELWRTYLPQEKPWPTLLDAETLLAGAAERRGNVSEVWDWFLYERHGLAVPEAAELFERAEVLTETEIVDESAGHNIALVRTTSGYHRIVPERRETFEADVRRLFERVGDPARFPLMTLLVTALRAS
jgi:ubiquinone/menaquinone biosynthesis C-methylase UbiE